MTVSAGYGFILGNPNKIMIGWDSDANGCGYSTETQAYKMLYWPAFPSAEIVSAL